MTLFIIGMRLAVDCVRMDIGVLRGKPADFVRQGMMVTIAGAMDEPDVFATRTACQCVQHADHGRQTHPGAYESNRPGGFRKYELSGRRTGVDERALLHLVVKMARGHAEGLALYADSVVAVAGRVGQRVGASYGFFRAWYFQLDGQMLAGFELRQRRAVAGLEHKGRDIIAFANLVNETKRANKLRGGTPAQRQCFG